MGTHWLTPNPKSPISASAPVVLFLAMAWLMYPDGSPESHSGDAGNAFEVWKDKFIPLTFFFNHPLQMRQGELAPLSHVVYWRRRCDDDSLGFRSDR